MASTHRIFDKLFGLDGQVAVVTGGAGRIGTHVSAGLAAAGAKVCVLDIEYEPAAKLAERVAAESGQDVIAIKADCTLPAELEAAAAEVTSRLGPPSILVNATQFRGQGYYSSDISDFPLSAWQKVMDVNLTGVFLSCQAFGRIMAAGKGGNIVNLASTYGVVSADPRIYGKSGINSPVSYAASKAGVINLCRYLAVHWREKNIRVNCLVPGGVYDQQADEFVRNYSERTPLGRMAKADEYVGAILFMVSQASTYMTGSVVTVDGGWTAW